MSVFNKLLKPFLIIISCLIILISLLYFPIERDYPEYLNRLEKVDLILQIAYYLLTNFVIYLIVKSRKKLIVKILISFLIITIIPKVRMIILLVIDKDINRLLKSTPNHLLL